MSTHHPTTIGAYTIVRELGQGGMGIVYLARDEQLDRQVAIKALPDHFADDPERLARFRQEGKSLAQLNHANIASIYGVEEQDDQHYLILEFVEGPTLGDLLDRGPLPVVDAIEYAIDITRALASAHEAGVVHRDIKPDNIKVTPDGCVKVLDFGIAKSIGTGSSTGATNASTPTRPHSPTMPGEILGTASSMSPEQARGRSVDKRTDTWSFGVLLYEMLTGRNPFAGETPSDSIGAVLHKDIDFEHFPEDTPHGLERILKRCLQRDRTLRYHDFGDIRLDLEDARAGQASMGTRTHVARHQSTLIAMGLAGAVLFLLGVVAWRQVGTDQVTPLIRASILAPEGIRIDGYSIAPDGSGLSIIGMPLEIGAQPGPRAASLYIRQFGADAMTKIAGSEGVFAHRYSPDGQTIAFLSRGSESSNAVTVLRVPADKSSPPIEVMRIPGEFHGGSNDWFCWTARGELAFFDRTGLTLGLFDATTGQELRRLALQTSGETPSPQGLNAPFGDQHVSFQLEQYTDDGYQKDAAIIDIDTGVVTILVENAGFLRRATEATVLFSRRDTVFVSEFDESQLELVGPYTPVQTMVATTSTWRHGSFDLSNNGILLYRRGGVVGSNRDIISIDRDGTESLWTEEHRAYEEDIAITRDGSTLAVIIASPGGLYELWISEAERLRMRRLLGEHGVDYSNPIFLPDGESILVASWTPTSDEPGQLLRVPLDGSGPPQRMMGGWLRGQWTSPSSVAPDGSRALIVQKIHGANRLSEVKLDGSGDTVFLVDAPLIVSAHYAPVDPRMLAYISTESGRAEGYVRTIRDDELGPAIPVTNRGAWEIEWIIDETLGLCILGLDLERHEWITPVSIETGQVVVGESERTGRISDPQQISRAFTEDGRYVAIRHGQNEAPRVRLEFATGWLVE